MIQDKRMERSGNRDCGRLRESNNENGRGRVGDRRDRAGATKHQFRASINGHSVSVAQNQSNSQRPTYICLILIFITPLHLRTILRIERE